LEVTGVEPGAAAGGGAGAPGAALPPLPIGTIKGLMEHHFLPEVISQVGSVAPHPSDCPHSCCDSIWVVDATEELDVRVCRAAGCREPPGHIQDLFCPKHKHLQGVAQDEARQQRQGQDSGLGQQQGAAAAGEGSGAGAPSSSTPGSSSRSPGASSTSPGVLIEMEEVLGASAAAEAGAIPRVRSVRRPGRVRLTGGTRERQSQQALGGGCRTSRYCIPDDASST
jgi:hypothetical protein